MKLWSEKLDTVNCYLQGQGRLQREQFVVVLVSKSSSVDFLKNYLFIYLFLAALGLHCCVQASHWGGFSCCRAQALGCTGSVGVAHDLSCSVARGIFPDQESNPCSLHWQADSQPLDHQGSPTDVFLSCSLSRRGAYVICREINAQVNGWPVHAS